MDKHTTTKYIIFGNALVLIIGAISEVLRTPMHHLIMSTLFFVWVGMLIWHISPKIDQE